MVTLTKKSPVRYHWIEPFVGSMMPHDHTAEYVVIPDVLDGGMGYMNVLAQGPLRETDAIYFDYDVLVMDQGGQFWAEASVTMTDAPTCACGAPYYPGGRSCHPFA